MVGGMIRGGRALAWVTVLLLVILYSASIFTFHLIGEECGDTYVFEECSAMYGGLVQSMYSLFEAMTGEMEVVRPVVETNPWMCLFFLTFITITGFGLI